MTESAEPRKAAQLGSFLPLVVPCFAANLRDDNCHSPPTLLLLYSTDTVALLVCVV